MHTCISIVKTQRITAVLSLTQGSMDYGYAKPNALCMLRVSGEFEELGHSESRSNNNK